MVQLHLYLSCLRVNTIATNAIMTDVQYADVTFCSDIVHVISALMGHTLEGYRQVQTKQNVTWTALITPIITR